MPQRPAANDAISRGFREDERDDQRRERHLARGILVEVRGLRGAKKSNRETARYKKLLGCLRRLSLPGKLRVAEIFDEALHDLERLDGIRVRCVDAFRRRGNR